MGQPRLCLEPAGSRGRGGGLLGPLAASWLITLQKPGAGPGLNEASVF